MPAGSGRVDGRGAFGDHDPVPAAVLGAVERAVASVEQGLQVVAGLVRATQSETGGDLQKRAPSATASADAMARRKVAA
jgi:hypothetical protein